MKKLILIVVLTFMLVGCSNSNYENLTYKQLTNKLENKDTFIILFNDESSEGNLLKKTLEQVLLENNLKAFEINPNDLSEENKISLRPYFSYENASIIFIKDGVDPSKLSHITDELTDKEEMESHLINLGFIEEKADDSTNDETQDNKNNETK